ncbi:MAG: NAD-binding protein [Armatimonas sp.]
MSEDGDVLVCGLGRFGLRVVDELQKQGVRASIITHSNTRADQLMQAEAWGARILIGDFRFAHVREQAGEATCRAMILASSDDEASLEAALEVRAKHPEIPVVMRLTEERLAKRLREDFGIEAYAPPTLAADSFVDAALEAPVQESRESLPRPTVKKRKPRTASIPLLFFLGLLTLFFSGIAVFHTQMNLSVIDAAYFTITTLATVGYGDINLQKEPPLLKLFGIFLMVGGVFLVAGITSAFTTFMLSGELARFTARMNARRFKGHVIVCGLGSVGEAVASGLYERGEKVVVIDSVPIDDRVHDAARLFPVLIGDATRADILLQAGFLRARAVVAAVSSDAINLEIGLAARTLIEETRPDRPMRLVLRCFDPDLEARMRAVSRNYAPLSSARLAAPLFVEKALRKDI